MSISYGGDYIQDTDGGVLRPSSSVHRNRIINGDFRIDQRNAGASVTPTGNVYILDRWLASLSVSSKYSIQQNAGSVTPPVGFVNYLGVTSLSAYTVGAAEAFNIQQRIEGYNIADLGWGTANAKTVTLSFWAYSSLIGTFGGSLRNSGGARSYPFVYTISAANTWEYKTVTIAGDTSGTWLTTNGIGIFLTFNLGAGVTLSGTAGAWAAGSYASATGATSVVGTSGATFYITGVQLEVGSTATSFDYRPYGTELALCQRYYQNNFFGSQILAYNSSLTGAFARFTVPMRANPTVNFSSGSTFGVDYFGIGTTTITPISFDTISQYGFRVYGSGNQPTGVGGHVTTNTIQASAEL